jgi:ribosomal protein L21E
MMQIFKVTIGLYTQPEVFNLGLRSVKITLVSSLASTITHPKFHGTTVVSFREQGEKQIPSIIS